MVKITITKGEKSLICKTTKDVIREEGMPLFLELHEFNESHIIVGFVKFGKVPNEKKLKCGTFFVTTIAEYASDLMEGFISDYNNNEEVDFHFHIFETIDESFEFCKTIN
jgi:hypothetical protein